MKAAFTWWRAGALLVAVVLATGCGVATKDVAEAPPHAPVQVSVIAQGSDVATVAAAVHEVGGTVTRELSIIHAVAADVTPEQERALARHAAVKRVWQDGAVHAQSSEEAR
jgi:hypothetical protein